MVPFSTRKKKKSAISIDPFIFFISWSKNIASPRFTPVSLVANWPREKNEMNLTKIRNIDANIGNIGDKITFKQRFDL